MLSKRFDLSSFQQEANEPQIHRSWNIQRKLLLPGFNLCLKMCWPQTHSSYNFPKCQRPLIWLNLKLTKPKKSPPHPFPSISATVHRSITSVPYFLPGVVKSHCFGADQNLARHFSTKRTTTLHVATGMAGEGVGTGEPITTRTEHSLPSFLSGQHILLS